MAGDAAASARVDAVWWKFMQQRLAGFWPRNQADGTELGPTNRRDYYVNTIPCPYTETRVDETIRYTEGLVTVSRLVLYSYDREVSLAELAAELDSYSAAVEHRYGSGFTQHNLCNTEQTGAGGRGGGAAPD